MKQNYSACFELIFPKGFLYVAITGSNSILRNLLKAKRLPNNKVNNFSFGTWPGTNVEAIKSYRICFSTSVPNYFYIRSLYMP